jgi:hypothetical protein
VPEPWVVNASPLIILSRIGRLDFLESLAPPKHWPVSASNLQNRCASEDDYAWAWAEFAGRQES